MSLPSQHYAIQKKNNTTQAHVLLPHDPTEHTVKKSRPSIKAHTVVKSRQIKNPDTVKISCIAHTPSLQKRLPTPSGYTCVLPDPQVTALHDDYKLHLQKQAEDQRHCKTLLSTQKNHFTKPITMRSHGYNAYHEPHDAHEITPDETLENPLYSGEEITPDETLENPLYSGEEITPDQTPENPLYSGKKIVPDQTQQSTPSSIFQKLKSMFQKLKSIFQKLKNKREKEMLPATLLLTPQYQQQKSHKQIQEALQFFKQHTDQYSLKEVSFAYRTVPVLDINSPMLLQPPTQYESQLLSIMNLILHNPTLSSGLTLADTQALSKYTTTDTALTLLEASFVKSFCFHTILKQKMALVHHVIGTERFQTGSKSKEQIEALKKLSADLVFSIQTSIANELQMFITIFTNRHTAYTPDKKDEQRYQDVMSKSLNHIPLMNSREMEDLGIQCKKKATADLDDLSDKIDPQDLDGPSNWYLSVPKVFGQKTNKYSFSLQPLTKSVQKIMKIQQNMQKIEQQIHQGTAGSDKSKRLSAEERTHLEEKQKAFSKTLEKEDEKLMSKTAKLAKKVTTAVMKSIKKTGHKRAFGLPFTEESPLFQHTNDPELNLSRIIALNYLYKVAESSIPLVVE